MARQNKEASQAIWNIELESTKSMKLTPEHKTLVDIISKKIEDYSLTYDEYVGDVSDYLEKAANDEDPKEVIKNMCNYLIQKYNGSEEIRSE